MTTRNLYTSNTVLATFLSSFMSGDVKTAAQSAKELLDSGESHLVRRLATFAWLCDDPCYNTANRIATYQHPTVEPFLMTLLSGRTVVLPALSNSIATPPLPYDTAIHDTKLPWVILPNGWTREQANTLWISVKDALRNKRIERASYLTSYLLTNNKPAIVSLLKALNVKSTIQTMLETNDCAALAPRILALAYASVVYTEPLAITKNPVASHILTLPPPSGRAARTFRILPQACADWNVPIAPEGELQGAPRLIERGTTYWQEVVRTYNICFTENELQFTNDELLEAFYTNYFPDDIPDEWATDERRKSHGIAPFTQNPAYMSLASAFSQFVL